MNITSIQVGLPRPFGTKAWNSAIFKETVSGPVHVGKINLAGDAQADLTHHGGPDKAICVYPQEHYRSWKKTFDLDFSSGDFGENFTTQGMMESEVCIGDIFRIGSASVQISQPRQPCWKLAKRWDVKQLPLHIQKFGWTGWYFRVIEEGRVCANDDFDLIERPNTEWSVAKANELMHHDKTNWAAAAELADCPSLSANWRVTLRHRAKKRRVEDSSKRLQG
ncbi:MOSC domain-containing protein [Verrucomicrobiaceae bacterium R5-34]|nr:MOSC domain-containing protein [Verrucomicrobiaceae bacterium R5-34]